MHPSIAPVNTRKGRREGIVNLPGSRNVSTAFDSCVGPQFLNSCFAPSGSLVTSINSCNLVR